MDGAEFFFTLLLGMFVGTVMTLLIQRYGRRKVEKALGEFTGGPAIKGDERNIQLLTSENERQQGQLLRLEERLHVLERIATDSPKRLADTIDSLR